MGINEKYKHLFCGPDFSMVFFQLPVLYDRPTPSTDPQKQPSASDTTTKSDATHPSDIRSKPIASTPSTENRKDRSEDEIDRDVAEAAELVKGICDEAKRKHHGDWPKVRAEAAQGLRKLRGIKRVTDYSEGIEIEFADGILGHFPMHDVDLKHPTR